MKLELLSMELDFSLEQARHLARRANAAFISIEHLLCAFFDTGGVFRLPAENCGVRCDYLLEGLQTLAANDRSNCPLMAGRLPVAGPSLRHVLELAFQTAEARRSALVEPRDVLLSALESGVESLRTCLRRWGVDVEFICAATASTTQDTDRPSSDHESPAASVLERFGHDLTADARAGKLMPVMGREAELGFLIQTLLRKVKNNPVLVGEPGTGKTAIVESLAQRIAGGDVPNSMKNCRVIALDLTSLVAGAKYRGDFEERMKNIVDAVKKHNGEIILFLDELHTLIGAGGTAGGLDAANILKPALASGELRCIGATTFDEYRERIAKDAALARRFEQVTVEEPDDDTTLAMLGGIRARYEEHHGIHVTDEALTAIVKLSRRYLRDRCFPDKAIDVLDEAAARVRIKAERGGEAVGTSRDVCKEDIAAVVERRAGIPAARMLEPELRRMLKLEERIGNRVFGQDHAIVAVADAARIMRAGLRHSRRPVSCLFVGPTGVGKTELARAFAEAVFDDDDSIIRIDMSEFKDSHSISGLIGSRPGLVGSDRGGFLTEKIRRQPYSLVLFDEIEKAHPEVLNLLLGALGEGRMTDANGRFCDFSQALICFTSNLGVREANSYEGETEATIALQRKLNLPETGIVDARTRRRIIMEVVKDNLSPELFNRLDHVICFDALTPPVLERVVRRQLDHLAARLMDEHNVALSVDPAAVAYLATESYDPAYGARPVERTIQRCVLTPLALSILKGDVTAEGTVLVGYSAASGLRVHVSGTAQVEGCAS